MSLRNNCGGPLSARKKSKKRCALSESQVSRWSYPLLPSDSPPISPDNRAASDVLGRCLSGHPPAEKATAQEGAFQRAVAVNAAAAEARHLARRRTGPASLRRLARSTRALKSVSRPPSDLRVRILTRTAIRGPSAGASIGAGFATRVRRSLSQRAGRLLTSASWGVLADLVARPGRRGPRSPGLQRPLVSRRRCPIRAVQVGAPAR